MRFVAVLLASLIAFSPVDDFQGKIVSIADGDTVTVLRGTEQVKVRLDGIDAPEKNQSFGTRSRDALAGLVSGKTVTVQSKGTDRYGRTPGRRGGQDSPGVHRQPVASDNTTTIRFPGASAQRSNVVSVGLASSLFSSLDRAARSIPVRS